MGYGKMSTPINIISTDPIKDAEGFVTKGDNIIASVKAYKEVRNTPPQNGNGLLGMQRFQA
jgi:hypothetical protein